MMKRYMLVVSVFTAMHTYIFAGENTYESFCTNIVAALSDKRVQMSSAFTNQLSSYLGVADARVRSLAELTLSISNLDLFEKSLNNEYDECCRFCSNVLSSVDLPERSWQKSVASLIYASALHRDGKRERALDVCRTALAIHLASPTTDVECAVWSAMSRIEGDSVEYDITNSLRLAAALSVPVERRSSEWGAYTNGLPTRAIQDILN